VQGLIDFVKTLGAARLAAMGAVGAALIGFFAFLIITMTAVPMTALYTDLSPEDSSAIVRDLERQAVPYELRNDGTAVFVPKDKVTRLRMKLAEGGLPKGGGIGYEIFDKSEALGTTSFVQNINQLRAMEGELARTIRAIDRVQAARVHLVIPERPLFSRDKVEPSASIVLRVRGVLEAQQVNAIRHLVASAVNGMKPQRVSIVDETGQLLADGAADDPTTGSISADERRTAFEKRLRDQVESIVSSVVGVGRARVQLAADFDFNRITETQDRYDPEGRVLRSSQTREESTGTDNREGQVTVANELPGAAAQQPQQSRDQSKKSEEIVNYEISRTTKTETVEGGRINRISVAVLVDGLYAKNDKGEIVYQERPKADLDRIAALVRSAIGFNQKRGDQVEVVNLRFADAPQTPVVDASGWNSMLAFTKDDLMRGIELAVMAVLGIIVLLLVVRPLVRRIITSDAIASLPAPSIVPEATSTALTTVPALVPATPQSSPTAKMLDIAQVRGQVHAQSVQRVADLVEKNPNETVAVIRQWLGEEA
jgi:flagellar M-ring protein FliF